MTARSGQLLWTPGCRWLMSCLVVVAAVFIDSLTAQTTTTAATATDARRMELDDGSFWYGTQTMLCLAGVGAGPPRSARLLSRRSVDAAVPWRPDFLYVHRLLRYRGRVFEWGSGARGYHVGQSESVTDCPVTWESEPAGRSGCPAERLARWTAGYRRQYGGYNLLTNNCHQFANRAVALLLACSSAADRRVQTSAAAATTATTATAKTSMADLIEVKEVEADDPAGPSRPMKAAWEVLSWIMSFVTDGQKQEDK